MRLSLILLLLLFNGKTYADLSEKIFVETSFQISGNEIQDELIEDQSRIYAKSLIIQKYIEQNLKLPKNIENYHQEIIKNIFSKLEYNIDLVSFQKENEKIENNNIISKFSAYVKTNKNLSELNFWEILNNFIAEKKIDLVLSLELGLTYNDYVNTNKIFLSWKKKYNGAIIFIVNNNLLNNPNSIKFIDKKFNSSELNLNLDEVIILFDLAPFNLDICLKINESLNIKNYRTLAYKLQTACKTVHSKSINGKDVKVLNEEMKKLKKLDIDLNENYLINKIFNFKGSLPIKLESKNINFEHNSLEELIFEFERSPNLDHLKKLRDKFKSMELTLMNKYLTNQIGVSQNVQFKF